VRVALDTLKTRAAFAQRSALPVALRALVP
jgi:hypothetical protein